MSRVRVEVALRWGDQDEYGHVNNVAFARYLEEGRVRVFSPRFVSEPTGLELLFEGAKDAPHKMLVASQHIEFVGVLHYGTQPAVVEMWIGKIGGSNFEVHAEIIDGQSEVGAVVARAISAIVIVDSKTLRPIRLSQAEREALERWQGEPLAMRR